MKRISNYFGVNIPLNIIPSNTVLSDQAEAVGALVSENSVSRLTSMSHYSFLDWNNTDCILEENVGCPEAELIRQSTQVRVKSNFIISCLFQIVGVLDLCHLDQSIRHTILDNRILRSRYSFVREKISRLVDNAAVPPDILRGKELLLEVQSMTDTPFDFAQNQFLKIVVFQETENSYLLFIGHHSIWDATAVTTFLRSIQTSYSSLAIKNKSGNVNPKKMLDYIDWVNWKRSIPQIQKPFSFWRDYLRSLLLLFSKPAMAADLNNTGKLITDKLPANLTANITTICRNRTLTPKQLILASILLVLGATYKTADIILAIPISHRTDPGTEHLLGNFLDRLLIRLHLDRSFSLFRLFSAVKESAERALENAMFYGDIFSAIDRPIHEEPFEYIVSVYTPSEGELKLELEGCEVCSCGRKKAAGAKFPVMFEFWPQNRDGDIEFEIEFMVERFIEKDMRLLAEKLQFV